LAVIGTARMLTTKCFEFTHERSSLNIIPTKTRALVLFREIDYARKKL